MGILYVVATPIGNLEDITLRALRVLREVQLIAAEDTRRTARLLQHYSITTPTTSLHEHNERQKTPHLLQRLAAGEDIALVSDAGTPLVSDPGRYFVRSARQAGQKVVALPGASAIQTMLAAAGVDASSFTFLGFPPSRAKALTRWVEEHFRLVQVPTLFFEAPHRLRKTLTALESILGDRPIIVGRELTKLHEELVEQPITAHLVRFVDPKGELVLLVPPQPKGAAGSSPIPRPEELSTEVGQVVEKQGLSPRRAARVVAQKYGISVNAVYKARAGEQ